MVDALFWVLYCHRWFWGAMELAFRLSLLVGLFLGSGGYFTLMMVVRGFRPLAFALMVILPGADLERTMSWHLP